MSAGDLDVSLTRLAPGVADLVRAADALVREVDPDAVWVVWPYPGTVGYGVGPAEDSEHHAHLATLARHLDLGLDHGASLDHGGLLDGAGTAFPQADRAPPASSDWPSSAGADPDGTRSAPPPAAPGR